MKIDVDETIRKNNLLLDRIARLARRRFLGPRAIAELVIDLVGIVSHYQEICYGLVALSKRPGGDTDAGD